MLMGSNGPFGVRFSLRVLEATWFLGETQSPLAPRTHCKDGIY